MTIAILRSEIRKITRRWGSFWAATGGTVGLALTVIVVSLIVRAVNEGVETVAGEEAIFLYKNLLFIPLVLFVVVAAQAGAWDLANGTFRYMAVTGRSRPMLCAGVTLAVIVTALAVVVPYVAVGLVQALVVPLDQGDAASAKNVLGFAWFCFLQVTFWSLFALAVGALLRSNGAAIAISVILYLGGFVIGGIIGIWSEFARDLLPNFAVTRAAGEGEGSLALAIVVTAAWLVLAGGAALLRTVRSEY